MGEKPTFQEVLEMTRRLTRHEKLRLLAKLAPELERDSGQYVDGTDDEYSFDETHSEAWRTFTYDEVN